MQIGNRYSDEKMYSGFKFYDMKPLLNDDIHESADIARKKSAYLMNNLLGCGVLNTPSLFTSSVGIALNEPAVVLIEGDIVLIQKPQQYFALKSDLKQTKSGSGSVCIVGWYQHLNSSSRITKYGGVDNDDLSTSNELIDNKFSQEISTRYQFRWMTTLLDDNILSQSGEFDLEIPKRDINGYKVDDETQFIRIYKRIGNTLIAKPKDSADMEYIESDLYIVPIVKFDYDKNNDTFSCSNYLPLKPKGTSGFISSEGEPTGEHIEGTLWYNPTSKEFKTYVPGEGFVASASKMAFIQRQRVHTMRSTDTSISIGIEEYDTDAILQVSYEGLLLVEGEHYTINPENASISLVPGFSVYDGENITFTVTKIVEANEITNITALFTEHMRSTGSDAIEAHVKLSDTASHTLDSSKGVAATPKAVYDAKYITDTTTNKKYKFGITNGLLYIEEE